MAIHIGVLPYGHVQRDYSQDESVSHCVAAVRPPDDLNVGL